MRVTLLALVFIVGFALCCQSTNAQQLPQHTQYMYNTLSLNPAYTGTNNSFQGSIQFRSQWLGIEGAPQTQVLNLSGNVSEKVGLGLNIFNDRIGPSNQLDLKTTFSYSINLGYKAKMSFGMNAGLDILNIDYSKGSSQDANDPLLSGSSTEIKPIIGGGLYFYSDQWYLGLSIPNFISSKLYNSEEEVVVSRKTHFYLIGGYVFELSPSVKFKPAFLIKAVEGAPVTMDMSSNFLIKEKLILGVSYRFDDAASALAGFNISNSFFIGYSYDVTLTDLSSYNQGSHEIIFKFAVPDIKKKAKSPRFF
jgi:type IX secretion system PorP/SprF family membrane protein